MFCYTDSHYVILEPQGALIAHLSTMSTFVISKIFSLINYHDCHICEYKKRLLL